MTLLGSAALGVAGIAAGGLAWGAVEARAFTTRHVRVPALAEGSGPIRVLHISDIHLMPSQRAKLRWLGTLADLKPDLVVNTGDNLAHPRAAGPLLDALGPLLALPGAFVHGSNDYFRAVPKNPFTYFRGPTSLRTGPAALPWEALTDAFVAAGWRDLRNARATMEVGGARVDLVGLDDPHIDRDRMPAASPGAGGARLRLGLVHAPYARALAALRDDGARVILAGHTHGGQVCIPGLGALVTNCDLDRRRARGLSGWPGARPDRPGGEGSVWLNVSAGIGTSPYARVRFACRPEASLLTLVAAGT
ncbi:MAG TPA: metallophosphoesterase [Demequinaceae bacterium]